jgi:hypothetical protein
MQHENNASKEDETLYNAINAALIIGIVIVIVSLIFTRPAPEYFTEIYYTNHTLFPIYIKANTTYSHSFTIANHEKKDTVYPVSLDAEFFDVQGNRTAVIHLQELNVSVPKDSFTEISMNYSLPDFFRAKVITSLPNKNHEIHFFVYNKNSVMQYSDTIASLMCLNKIKISSVNKFTIRAKGTYNPNMKVRIDGKEIYATVVNNTNYIDFVINKPLNNSILDIIYDNDFSNKTMDRNLYVESIQTGNNTLYPLNLTYNLGQGIKAFDCQNTKKVNGNLVWNGALRFKVIS